MAVTRPRLRGRVDDESGLALVIALMALSLMLAVGLALTMTTLTEARIAGHFQRGVEAQYAAEAILERVTAELDAASDWNPLLTGAARSSFAIGTAPVNVVPPVGDGAAGANVPVWRLIAFGPLESLLPGAIRSPIYVLAWVGDDMAENDGDPLRDGGTPVGCDPAATPSCADGNPGTGVIQVVAEARAPDGTRRTSAVTLARPRAEDGATGTQMVVWRQDD